MDTQHYEAIANTLLQGHSLLIQGSAGTGKTTALRDVIHNLRAKGKHVQVRMIWNTGKQIWQSTCITKTPFKWKTYLAIWQNKYNMYSQCFPKPRLLCVPSKKKYYFKLHASLQNVLHSSFQVCATTALAAKNLGMGARTIHSTFGLGVGQLDKLQLVSFG